MVFPEKCYGFSSGFKRIFVEIFHSLLNDKEMKIID